MRQRPGAEVPHEETLSMTVEKIASRVRFFEVCGHPADFCFRKNYATYETTEGRSGKASYREHQEFQGVGFCQLQGRDRKGHHRYSSGIA